MKSSGTIAALITTLIFSLPSASARELWEDDWIEVRSPHFTINSNMSERDTVDLSIELENFRQAVTLISNVNRVEERVPTTIFLLDRQDRSLGFSSDIAGYFSGGMRENLAVMVEQGGDSDHVLKHEYTHFLTHNQDRRIYPVWFREGIAELLATVEVDGRNIEYGHLIPSRTSWLQGYKWESFRTLLTARHTHAYSRAQTAMIYAQSWLMVHYLMLGRSKAHFNEEMSRFLELSETGIDPVDAFNSAFDMSLVKLENRLSRYGPRMKITRLQLNEPFPPVKTTTRKLSSKEVATGLGNVSLQVTGPEDAEPFFEAALTIDPAYTPALIGRAKTMDANENFDASTPIFLKAINKEPDQPELELDYALHLLTQAHYTEDSREQQRLLIDARRHFARSYKINAGIPETLAMNGATYLFPGEDVSKGFASLQAAYQLLPSSLHINELLARAYALNGDLQTARDIVQGLLTWATDRDSSRLEKLQEALNATPPNTNGFYPKPDKPDL